MMRRARRGEKSKMRGVPGESMRFVVLDEKEGIVETLFNGFEMRSEADVIRWRTAVERELGKFGRRLMLLINLDGLVVRPAAAKAFGQHRAEVLERFSIHSFRYGGDGATKTTVFTTAVLAGAEANVYPTREAAFAALKAAVAARGAASK
jgi:hypothetical protein